MKHNDVLDVVKRFTVANPGVAVKAVSPTERSAVCLDGEEKTEHGAEVLPVLEPDETTLLLDEAGYIPTTFYLGTWDKNSNRFVPDGQPLSWAEFSALAKSE